MHKTEENKMGFQQIKDFPEFLKDVKELEMP